MPLPEAYRSLPRPSSPVSTKASTVCPKKLDSMFEISCHNGRRGFHPGLPIYNGPARTPALAVKNFAFGNQNIFKDRKNGSRDSHPAFTQSLCSLSNHISLHTDVKERTLPFVCAVKPSFPGSDGGPGRTRTYDPRLIKAVL